MPKYKKNSSIQSNIIENSDQNTSVSTFNNQHSIQGIHGNTVQGLSGGGEEYVSTKNLQQIQHNQVPSSTYDSSVATFESQNSIQGLDKMSGGGCSMVNNVVVPCDQTPILNTPKCGPVLSQSEMAFDSRYHTSNNSVNKSPMSQNGSGYYLELDNRIGGLPNVQHVYDSKPPLYSPKDTRINYEIPTHCNNQFGGAYRSIINPETGRRVKLTGKLGKSILRNYLIYMKGGSQKSVFTDDMTKRSFDCTQPYWNANCV